MRKIWHFIKSHRADLVLGGVALAIITKIGCEVAPLFNEPQGTTYEIQDGKLIEHTIPVPSAKR